MRVQEHILKFQVAMNDLFAMNVVHLGSQTYIYFLGLRTARTICLNKVLACKRAFQFSELSFFCHVVVEFTSTCLFFLEKAMSLHISSPQEQKVYVANAQRSRARQFTTSCEFHDEANRIRMIGNLKRDLEESLTVSESRRLRRG